MVSTQCAPAVSGGIPHDVFDALNLPDHERFAVWRESVLPLFEPQLEPMPAEGFFARVDGFNLRRLFVCLTEFSSQCYLRRNSHRVDGGAAHLLIQMYLTGGYVGHNGRRPVRVGPGDISLLDLGHSLETRAQRSSALSLVIPRDALLSFMPPGNAHVGSVIPAGSAVGKILGHHLLAVWKSLHRASADEDERITRSVIGAVAGAFSGYGRDESVERLADDHVLDAICDYIERNLSADELTPEHLCRTFGCSRARLYRLFQPLGGVAAYIRRARLKRCLHDLTEPLGPRGSVIDVATRWGFTSHSHFSRLFRAHFGITPTEAIEQSRSRRSAQAEPARRASSPRPAFHHWLRQL